MSIEDRQPLECNADCWKKQRDSRLASAFGSSKDFGAKKARIKLEYYPEDVLEFAQKNPKFVSKVEGYLTDIVLQKSSRNMSNLSNAKRNFLAQYVFEHFKLDMCTYGGEKTNETDVLRNPTFVVDISWKEGCKVPEILASEVVDLVNKGIMKANNEESRAKIFESTIVV